MGNQEFGSLLGRLREQSGVSPELLAKRLGRKSKTTVYDLERGAQDPTVNDLNILAAELHTSVEVLLLALGARINPPEAALLDYDLVHLLRQLDPAETEAVWTSALGQLFLRDPELAQQLRELRKPSTSRGRRS